MSTATYDQPVSISATRAMKSVVDSPNWPSNLLWLTIAVLLQSVVVGQIFIFGYGAELIRERAGFPNRKSSDIDSNRLGDYFMLGLWPFLVYLVASMVLSVIVFVPLGILFVLLSIAASQFGELAGAIIVIAVIPLTLLASFAFAVVLGPVLIRAMICQDFMKSLDFQWTMSFIKLTMREMVISTLVFFVLSTAVYLLGTAIFCVGALPAAGLISGGMMHLLAQWYELFLSRGGEPVPPATESILDARIV